VSLIYLLIFVGAILLEAVFLQVLLKPGFLAPDLLLVLLLVKAYTSGRVAILWAMFGGALLDMLTDTLGLNLALEVLSLYLFLLASERFLFRTALTFLLPAAAVFLLKKLAAILLMKSKFSFEVSPALFVFAWTVEMLLISGIYFLYLRRNEPA